MPKPTQCQRGFTLLELMLVVTIIGVLAAISIPQFSQYTKRAKLAEGGELARPAMQAVAEYYDRWGKLPADNVAAGLPVPQAMRGARAASIEVVNGMVSVEFAKTVDVPDAGFICYRPAIFIANPAGALVWVGNLASPPDGFSVVGELDATVVDGTNGNLLSNCKK